MCSRPDLTDLVGVPFVAGGGTPSGCDCWGLVRQVLARYGEALPDYREGALSAAQAGCAVDAARGAWQRIPAPEEPCLVLFSSPDLPGVCNHVGAYIGDGRVLHTISKCGSHIVPLSHPYWARRVEGFYRHA